MTRLKGFCRWAAVLLLFAIWLTTFTLAVGQRKRFRPSVSSNNISFLFSENESKQLCTAVLPSHESSSCSVGNCRTTPGSKNTMATNISSTAEESSPHVNAGLAHVIEMMEDGIRVMDSQVTGGAGDSTFILGMTGAGKTTITLLLTAYTSLFSCKRTSSDLGYVIRDAKKKISTVDSLSKTKVPEIIHDPHLGTTIYDCPGFSDTNSTDELTNAYFIKHALDSSKKAKFLLVAPFHTLTAGGDRHYFGNLLLHTVKTIKNVEKYNESFALAVTFGNPTSSPTEIVNNVAGFLNTFLNEELERKFQGQGEEVLNRSKALLDSLLYQDDDGTFVAIAVFRSPTSHGQLTDLVTTIEDRELVLEVLTNRTSYTAADPQDFGYSVSEAGKLRAAELGSLIDEIITEKFDQFWAKIQRRYESELYQLTDPVEHKAGIGDTLHTFRTARQLFNTRLNAENGTGTEGPKEFVINLMNSIAPLRLDLPSNPSLSSVLLQESQVRFVETLAEKPLQLQWTNWLRGLEPIEKYLQIYANWIKMLIQLEHNLGKYDIQKSNYCFPEFRDESSGSIDVTAARIHTFISVESAPKDIYRTLKNALTPFISGNDTSAGPTAVNFRQLNPIIERFSSGCNEVGCKLHGTSAKLTGNFILASKLNASTSCISASTKQVTIFAWDTFFLDAPINAKSITGNGTFSLVLIASKLKSFGHRIDLSGRDGQTPGNRTAGIGQDGADGTDGEAGGYFVGLFGEKEGVFSVESNGGKGGDGQHGGEGSSGRSGIIVTPHDLDKIRADERWYLPSAAGGARVGAHVGRLNPAFDDLARGLGGVLGAVGAAYVGIGLHITTICQLEDVPISVSFNFTYPGRCNPWNELHDSYVVVFYGMSGRDGQRGGNGGAAGQGAARGVGRVYEISANHARFVRTGGNCGAMGTPGQGGKGGMGGPSQNMTACFTDQSQSFEGLAAQTPCKLKSLKQSTINYAIEGPPGLTGSIPTSSCKPHPELSLQSYTPVIIDFKSTARSQLQSPSARRRYLYQFLKNLEQNKDANAELFTVKSLISDLVALEEQLPSHLNSSYANMPFFYESILNRTANMLTAANHSVQEHAILREAASVAYSRLAMLNKKTNGRSNLITDLERYIGLTNNILQNLKAVESKSNAAKQIVATKEKFTAFLHSKVKEIDDLVQQAIEPEISKIQDELSKTMHNMIQQLIEERNKVGKVRNALYSQQLDGTLLLKQIFTSLKLGAQIVSFVGPWGAAAGAAISTASSVAQTFISVDTGPSLDSLGQELQKKALTWHFETKKEKLENDKAQLVDLKAKFQDTFVVETPQGGGDTWAKIEVRRQAMTASLGRVDQLADGAKIIESLDIPGGGGYEVIESLTQEAESIRTEVRTELQAVEASLLETEAKNQVEAAEKALETKAEKTERRQETAQKLLERTQKLLAIARTGADLYKLFRQDDSTVSELAQAENLLHGIDGKIKTVNTRMPQILKQLQKITTEAFKSAQNQSSSGAALDISNWQLQSTLDDISSDIESKIAAGVPIDSQVKAGMRTLKEAFRTLFKVCDRIQDYMAEQRMANFVADSLLSTVEAAPLQQDPELHRNLQKLRLISQSNLVLNYWRNIENSFRMYVFPYADIYLTQIPLLKGEHDLLLLPQNLTDLPTLVEEISTRTIGLRTKLVTLRTTINPELHTNVRVGGFPLARPFYTWTHDEVKPILANLLSGQVVNLIADVRNGLGSFDAVKFNATHLHLIHENAEVNLALQTALAPFSLNMTHTGVNYYRFDGQHYRVYSEPLSFQVSYERGPNEHKNLNYVNLGQGPPLLSPYTLWTFQLYTDSADVTSDSLRQFCGQKISLVLTGRGTYVTNSAGQTAARKVDRFYKAVEL